MMKVKRLLVLVLLIGLFCSSGFLSFAIDPDIIHRMEITITPQDDGYINIHYALDYEAATDFPPDIQYLEIGVPNTDFILLDYSPDSLIASAYGTTQNGAFVHMDFNKLPKAGDRFTLEFTVKQGSMYNKQGQNDLSFQFVPGWFDFAIIKELKVIVQTDGLNDLVLTPTPDEWQGTKAIWVTKNLNTGEKAEIISVLYRNSVNFSDSNSPNLSENPPNQSVNHGYTSIVRPPRTKTSSFSIGRILFGFIIIVFLLAIFGGSRNRYRAGRYGGGYWAPPPPRHHFRSPPPPPPIRRPPPRGFGGGFGGGPGRGPSGGGRIGGGSGGRIGGGGGGRSGGGGSRSCACACACAGGGRVGCSERGYQVLHWLIKNKNRKAC